ncbi:hypothetical protein PVL29_021987 [Vitis rotundifolia]|uniref:Uncharacterized protein n=1 Tax=Vitis rotundifolia TaxID=103349 RepID=A0AA38YU64_VITRO|nr:hypothetical protein PVL29_021987 [Vitis rotundifolia]
MKMEQMKKNGNGKEEKEEIEFPVHSQVRKIKQESENWSPEVPEVRPVITRQLSRSRLGPAGLLISVGHS